MAKKVKEAYEGDSEEKSREASAQEGHNEASGDSASGKSGNNPGASESNLSKDAGEENAGSVLAELDRVTQELEEANSRADEMQSRHLRAVADLENFRRRAVKEREEMSKRIIADFIEELLPVLDNFKLGMTAANNHPEAKDVAHGFQMVLDQFKEVLQNKGIEEIAPDGEAFDPQFHEGVSHLNHDEVPENHVIETIRCGYRWKDRLIRPATVVVSRGKSE